MKSASGKRKRGLHQRRAQAEENLDSRSALCTLLMTMLASGTMSGVKVHEIAQAAQNDLKKAVEGLKFNDLLRLAKLQRGSNLVRSVHGLLSKTSLVPHPLRAAMPYIDGVHETLVLLPHELFAYFWDHQDIWKTKILGDPSALPKFWDGLKNHPVMTGHPVSRRQGFQEWCLPISIHGDEVPCYGIGKIWSRSVLSFSWCSMIQSALGGSTAQVMLYIWGCFEKFNVKSTDSTNGTLDTFFRILHWSLECLYTGKWPARDWRGNLYPPGSPERHLVVKCSLN